MKEPVKLKLTKEEEENGWEVKTINGMQLKVCDLKKIGKIEFKMKQNVAAEEKLEEVLIWIENHKKKSEQHDKILQFLTYTVGLCLVTTVMMILVAFTLGKLIEIYTLFSGLPVFAGAVFIYFINKKIKRASKE